MANYGRVRIRLGSGALSSRWKPIERASGTHNFTFDPEDFSIRGFGDPMERIAVDVQISDTQANLEPNAYQDLVTAVDEALNLLDRDEPLAAGMVLMRARR